MHQPKPSGISASAGFAPSEDDLAESLTWFRKTGNLRQVSGLDTLKMCRTLTSGAMAVVYEAGGLHKIHIIGPDKTLPPPDPPEFDGTAPMKVPMWYCGHAPSSVVDEGEGLPVLLTDTTRRRMVGYDEDEALPAASQVLHEFVVEYNNQCSELLPKTPAPNKVYTHFGNQHPTWYSGAMPAVLQIARGFGKQRVTVGGEKKATRKLTLPKKVEVEGMRELGVNTRLPGYLGQPPLDGVLNFDYKFLNTDTVGFDGESRPWLVKVSSGAAFPAGVWAMPLPMIPMTTTEAFREWIEEKGDAEILAVLDQFGGMPSGESWPRDFQGWRRAGVVIKVCDTADYFSHTPYTTPCGFAFNSRATEGYATCYEHVEGGINLGHSYKLKLALVAADHDGRLPKEFRQETDTEQEEMNKVLSSLYRKVKAHEPFQSGAMDRNTVFYKVRRAGPAKVFELRDNLEAWINLELDPIANHSGSVSRVATGNLVSWTSGKLNGILPEAKLPESITQEPGVWSLSGFTDRRNDTEDTKYPECDTILYGFYDEKDNLKTLKYFREADKDKKDDKGEEPPECMLVGDFEWKGPVADKYIIGRFHTSDVDDREEVGEKYTQYRHRGEYMYVGDWCVMSIVSAFTGDMVVFRDHFYLQESWETQFDKHHMRNAIAVPYGRRGGYIYYKEEADYIAGKVYEKAWAPVRDANSFEGYANWKYIWYFPEDSGPDRFWYTVDRFQDTPDCALETKSAAWRPSTDEVEGIIKYGFPNRYWGDTGGMTVGKRTFPPNWQPTRKETKAEIENEKYETAYYDGSIKRVVGTTQIPNYLNVSPDAQGNPYPLYGVRNAAGECQHSYINEGNLHFARSKLVRDKQIPRFFGVINE